MKRLRGDFKEYEVIGRRQLGCYSFSSNLLLKLDISYGIDGCGRNALENGVEMRLRMIGKIEDDLREKEL